MAYNLGSVSTAYNLGYTGAYTGSAEAYVLTAHGIPQANSIMEGNQFGTTGPVYFDITGGNVAIANPDWSSINTDQLWLTDINDIPAFNPVSAGSVTYTIDYRIAENNNTGTFTRSVDVSPNTPINLGFINLQTNSVRFTWQQG
jgi:hypothetical protein